MAKKNFEEMLYDATDNIQNDRAIATKLLAEVMKYLAKDPSTHQSSGMVAAKYLETLQRSNEQLVKIAALKQKNSASGGLSDSDKKQLYDLINEEG
tara:strand:- start:920 stop:1207 length:288 start_codon:yes stop_codon:yes gene_type:complete